MRISAVLRRTGSDKNDDSKSKFVYQGLSIDFAARVVTVDGERVQMTPANTSFSSIWSTTKASPSPANS